MIAASTLCEYELPVSLIVKVLSPGLAGLGTEEPEAAELKAELPCRILGVLRKFCAAHVTLVLQLEPPTGIVQAVAEMVPEGRVTVAEAGVVPLGPVQLMLYELVIPGDTLSLPPVFVLEPLQPPEAVQLLAPVAVQLRVDESPGPIRVGDAVRVTTGGLTTTVALRTVEPPGPVQDKV